MKFTDIIRHKGSREELLHNLWREAIKDRRNPFLVYKINLIRTGHLVPRNPNTLRGDNIKPEFLFTSGVNDLL